MGSFMKKVHVVVFLLLALGVYWKPDSPLGSRDHMITNELKGGRLNFLTFLNLLVQCVFFGIGVLGDLAGWSDGPGHRGILQRIHDALFMTLVFPLGVFVCFIFWSLYAVDRELILPVSMDAWFPGWLNHVMHTLPVVAVLVELCLVNHRVVGGHKAYLPILVAYSCYLTWLCYIAYSAGVWVYPVFEVLDFKARSIFLAALLLPNVFLVYLVRKIHGVIWGSPKDYKRKKGKQQ